MARLVYACKFEIPTQGRLRQVSDAYSAWIVQNYRARQGIPTFEFDPVKTSATASLPEGHNLSSTSYSAAKGDVVRILWSFPDDIDTGLRWQNEIRLGQFEERCSVEHQILIEISRL